jgi:hypothetical protein
MVFSSPMVALVLVSVDLPGSSPQRELPGGIKGRWMRELGAHDRQCQPAPGTPSAPAPAARRSSIFAALLVRSGHPFALVPLAPHAKQSNHRVVPGIVTSQPTAFTPSPGPSTDCLGPSPAPLPGHQHAAAARVAALLVELDLQGRVPIF